MVLMINKQKHEEPIQSISSQVVRFTTKCKRRSMFVVMLVKQDEILHKIPRTNVSLGFKGWIIPVGGEEDRRCLIL